MFDLISDWAPEILDFFVPGAGEAIEGFDLLEGGMDAFGGLDAVAEGTAAAAADFAPAAPVEISPAVVDPNQGHATMFDFLENGVTDTVTGGGDVNIADGFGDVSLPDISSGGGIPDASILEGVGDIIPDVGNLPTSILSGVTGQTGTGTPVVQQTGIGGRVMGGGVAAALGIARAAGARIMLTVNGVRTAVSTSTIWKWVTNNPAAMTVVAGAAGMTVDQLARVLISNPRRRTRRRRGISPRDLTTTRRTMRRIMTMSRSLSQLCHHAPFTHRKR